MKSSVMTQFKNARVFSDGKAEWFGNRVERKFNTSVSHSTARVSREGKDEGLNTGELGGGQEPSLRAIFEAEFLNIGEGE